MSGNTLETILKGDTSSRKESGETEGTVKRKDSRRVSFNTDIFPKIVDRQVVENGSASLKRTDSAKVLGSEMGFDGLDEGFESRKYKGDRKW